MRGDGRVFKRGTAWWISYYRPKEGKSTEQREPAILDGRPAKTEAEARRALKRRRDQIGAHRIGARRFKGPEQERLFFTDLLSAVERDYETKGRASLPQLRSHLKHVRGYFDGHKALAVDADAVRDFISKRRSEEASDASIQREIEAISRAFTLAAEDGKLTFTPVIPKLSIGDTNARQGFLSRADFEALLSNVEDSDLTDFIAWGWWTGMRKGEIAKLTWDAVDREAWTITLHARDAKSRKGRTLALEGPLRDIAEHRIKARRLDCPLIFHRVGEPVREFRKAWSTAAKKAGLHGVIFHDLRRSSIRNMVRAGVDPAVAMRISGHRTDATFRRYNILDDADLRDAITKTTDYVSALPKDRKVATLTMAENRR